MTTAVQKKTTAKAKRVHRRAKSGLSARDRAELLVGDVYRDGKRVTSGITVFELLAARRAKQAKP